MPPGTLAPLAGSRGSSSVELATGNDERRAWISPAIAGIVALGVFSAALRLCGIGAGAGVEGDVAAGAAAMEPSHSPGHAVHTVLGKAAALLPVGSIAFRVRLLSSACMALAAVFVFLLAVRVVRAVAGPSRLIGPLAAAPAGLAAGLSQPALAAAASADAYGLQALLGAVVLWGACDVGGARVGSGRLIVGALCLGLAAANHAPTGLLLVPPFALAVALAFADRGDPGADAASEGAMGPAVGFATNGARPAADARLLPATVHLSWIVAAAVLGLGAVAVLPMRSEALASPGALLGTVLGTRWEWGEPFGPPEGWAPAASPWVVLAGALGPVPLAIAGIALVGAVSRRTTRWIAAALAGFVLGPTLLRSGIGVDPRPEDVAGYLVVPAFCVATALAIPAAVALRLACAIPLPRARRRVGPPDRQRVAAWRARLAWGAGLVLAAAALLHAQIGRMDPGRASAVDRAATAAADALREIQPPDGVLLIEQAPLAALIRYDEEVAGRRPDMAVVSLPGLIEPGHARALAAAHPDLTGVIGPLLTDPERARPALAAAAERLASTRALHAEPGGLADASPVRSLFPRLYLAEVLSHAAERTEIGLALDATPRRFRLGRHARALAGTSLGASLSWNLARNALLAARSVASLTPDRQAAEGDPREGLRREALALVDESAAAGAPAQVVRALRDRIDGPLVAGSVDLTGVLDPAGVANVGER